MTQDDCILAERLLVLFVICLFGCVLLVECLEKAHPHPDHSQTVEPAHVCDCVIDVDDNRVPLVVSGRAVEVER